jgi:hypothetical protein
MGFRSKPPATSSAEAGEEKRPVGDGDGARDDPNGDGAAFRHGRTPL